MDDSSKEKLKLIGATLNAMRIDQDKSLEEVANDVGMTSLELFKIEEGMVYDVSLPELIRLSNYYAVKPFDLLWDE